MKNEEVQLLISHAESEMASRNWHQAIKIWSEVISFEGILPPAGAWIRMARCHFALKNYDMAEKITLECKEMFPEFKKAVNFLHVINSEKAKKYELKLINVQNGINDICERNMHIETRLLGAYRFSELSFVNIKGWVNKSIYYEDVSLVVENKSNEISFYELNRTRLDVLEYFNEKGLSVNKDCGFEYHFDLTDVVRFGINYSGETVWCYELAIKNIVEVIRGKDDWLFLANDTNKSLDQFIGKAILNDESRSRWNSWAKSFCEIQKKHNTCFLIANSKEKVFPDFYPFLKSEITVTEQVEEILDANHIKYINPIELMKSNVETYYKVDTHWSDYGAFLAFKNVISFFGLQSNLIQDLFLFEDINVSGDLGSKLHPIECCYKKNLILNRPLSNYKVFDNKIVGSGSIQVYINDSNCIFNKSILIFGGSSTAISLIKFFILTFRKVIFVNSPNAIILDFMVNYDIDFTLLQTNERYLINPCLTVYRLSEARFFNKLNKTNMNDLFCLL